MTDSTIIIPRSSFTALSGLGATVTYRPLRVTLALLSDSNVDLFFMITDKQKKFLRAKAHHLKPVVTAGNAGLSEAVVNEIEIALAHHELIKVRINGADRDERKQMSELACKKCNASLVQLIGHICVLYRPAKKPVIKLP